jgi:single-stranded-DNA-specific exonuclease
MAYHWNHLKYDASQIEILRHSLGIDLSLTKRLLALGITDYDAAKAFFRPSFDQLHHPSLMLNLDRAADRLISAIEKEEQITILGDYDADGVCGVALLYKFLYRMCKRKPAFYIPNRISEGYGLTDQGIAFGLSHKTTLLITIDLGTNQKKQVQAAQDAGMDVIVCDHHPCTNQADLAEPYALVNPYQEGCTYPNKGLSGCGVAFQLARAVAEKKHVPDTKLMPLLDLVAISLATDILPLFGENRILQNLGLERLSQTDHLGLATLLTKIPKKPPYSVSDIVYAIGPLLNAPGRMSSAIEAVNLLVCSDRQEAEVLAQRLASLNGQRRIFDEKQTKQAQSLIKTEVLPHMSPLVLYKADWSAGVIGITAGRLADQLHRPVVIFAKHTDQQYIGSARSAAGVDLASALRQCEHLVDEWGGHAFAAGLKISANSFEAFKSAFTAAVHALWLPHEKVIPTLDLVDALSFNRITPAFLRLLAQFAPFGPKNRSPVFYTKSVVKHGEFTAINARHLKLNIACTETGVVLPAIVFHQLEMFRSIPADTPFAIAFTIQDNSFLPGQGLTLQLKDFKLDRH